MLFLDPAELRGTDRRALEKILGRSDAVIAYGAGEIRGLPAAALLFADYAVLHPAAALTVDVPEAWAAAAWRLGRAVLRWYVRGARAEEIVDEITDAEPRSWIEEWTRHRSVMALDSAAALIRGRCSREGGDSLERAEFARLFAIGEPQKGLSAFLAKVRPTYIDSGEPDR